MKSKTSFINKGILNNDFKRYTWIGIVYLLGLLVAVPLKLAMIYTRPEAIKVNYNAFTYLRVLEFDSSPLLLILLLTVPVLTGILLFRYLQYGKAADMEHALPIKRETLYNTHILTGLILLLTPVIITALITWALVAGLGIEFIAGRNILVWLEVAFLLNLLLFLSTVAVGMFTGLSVLQGLLTYILLLVPSGLSLLVFHNLSLYVYGFPNDYYSANLEKLSPLLRLPNSTPPLPAGEIILYLLLCVALYFLGRYLYRRRNIETAGDAITIEVLRPLFKYAVTFCTMLLLGSYFHSAAQGSMFWTYFGYLLGAGLGYFLTEILLNKSLYVFQWQRVRGLGVYGLVIIVLIGLLYTDCTGYEKRLPELSQIKNVYMDSYFYPLLYGDEMYAGNAFKPSKAIYDDHDNIVRIQALHRQIIARRGEEKEASSGPSGETQRKERICLAYELKNGRHLYRDYIIPTAVYAEQLKPIYESLEYKFHRFEILRANPDTIKMIDIHSRNGNKHVRIAEPERIKQAIAVLRQDVLEQSFAEMTMEKRPAWADINITIALADDAGNTMPAVVYDRIGTYGSVTSERNNYYDIGMEWQKSYTHFERWLQDTGLYDQARLLPGSDIVHAIINYAPDGIDEAGYRQLMQAGNAEEKPGVLKITDPDKLELCLRTYQSGYKEGALYTVFFKVNTGNSFWGLIPSAEAPDFIKPHFTP